MICSANQLTGFYMRGKLAVKGIKEKEKKDKKSTEYTYFRNTCNINKDFEKLTSLPGTNRER